MPHKKTNSADNKVAYFFGFVLISITTLCIWLMASVPVAPTQEVEKEISYDSLVSKAN
jgi:hypothetical protein